MKALFPTYSRFNIAIESAEGSTVTDVNGKTYLDFGAGIGVNNLGHRHPAVQAAVEEQLQQYWHVSNLYELPIQSDVADLIATHSVADRVFFCNSGAEANEAAIKFARKATGKTKIITFQKSFHGRTFATMSATGQDKIQAGFGPMLPTFEYVPFNDIQAVKDAIDENTAAVFLEVIQGEGGVVLGDPVFMKALEEVCQEKEILLMVDEIQTGIGRTGKTFGYEHYGIEPDVITLAKGLGNGLPVGAMVAKEKYAQVFGPGSHGSTFGGNPLAMAAAKTVLETVSEEAFLAEVEEKGAYLKKELEEKLQAIDFVTSIDGKGLMIGMKCDKDISAYLPAMIDKGLLALSAGTNVIRLLPPLTITKEEIDRAVSIIQETLKEGM